MTKPKPPKKTKRDDRPPESDSSKSFTGDNTHCLIQDAVKLAVSEEIRGLRLRVDEQQYELERMSGLLETKEEKILQLEGKIVTSDHKDLDEKVNAMARQIHIELNEIEQYSREGCIYGLNVHPNTNYVSAVLHFLQNKLNINLHPHDLVAVHPLPRRTSSNKDSPPPIFVKFVRYTDKSLVIRERRNLRGKGISIHEDMTHKNRLLLNRVTIDDRFEKAWFSNGSVWGLLKDVNKKVRVNLYQSCDDAIKDAERFEPRNQQLRGNPGQADLRHPNSYNAFRPRTPQQRPNNPIPIERRLGNICVWLKVNRLSLNTSKSKFMLFYQRQKRVTIPNIKINNTDLRCIDNFNFLGLTFNKHLGWADHVNKLSSKICKIIGIMNKLQFQLPQNILLTIYNSLILSQLNYCLLGWGYESKHLYKLQKRAIRIIE